MVRMKLRRPLKYGNRRYGEGDVAEVSAFHARVFRMLGWGEDAPVVDPETVVEPETVVDPETVVEPEIVPKPKRKHTRRDPVAGSDDARRYKRRDMRAEE